MKISKYLPFANRKRHVVAKPLTLDRDLFYMEWTRAPVLKSQGAENYWKSSFSLPPQSLSGPLPTNAMQIRTINKSPPPSHRALPDNAAGGTNLLNGQAFAQPLFISELGTYGRVPYPVNALPFQGGLGYDAIAPAGIA